MKEVVFSKDGKAVSDYEAENYAYRLIETDVIHISNDLVLNYVRVMIAEGALDHKDIKFTFIDQWTGAAENVLADKNGSLSAYPQCLDFTCNALSRILTNRGKK